MVMDGVLTQLLESRSGSPVAERRFLESAAQIVRRTLGGWHGGLLSQHGLLDDVVQDTLLRAWVHRTQCRATSDAGVAEWLRAIARLSAIDALRAERSQQRIYIDVDTMGGAEPTSEPSALAVELATLSWTLGSDASEVLWLRLVSGREWAEIGAELGITWTAARRRYQRAIARLRALVISRVQLDPADSLLHQLHRQARDRESAHASTSAPPQRPNTNDGTVE
jgi:RNA polymerase sigma factor (sigma-70 family)